jgi:hypothetical protein
MTTHEKAYLLIASVRAAMKNGCRHYDPETGELLASEAQVLRCMRNKFAVRVDESDRTEVTTPEQEMCSLLAEMN